MHYVYVLRSEVDGKLHTGCTRDLKKRLQEHNTGAVSSTADRSPLDLIYYEACLSESGARSISKRLTESVSSNPVSVTISHPEEGYSRDTNKDRIHFLHIARGSASEFETH